MKSTEESWGRIRLQLIHGCLLVIGVAGICIAALLIVLISEGVILLPGSGTP